MTTTDSTTSDAAPSGKRRLSGGRIALIVAGAIVAFLVITGVVVAVNINGTQKEMVDKETALSAQYSDNQNELSTYISTIKESLGIADRNTAALDTVLTDAVKGRYDGNSSAQPGNGQLFSAITEAYPDLTQVSINYSKVQDAITSGRQSYKNVQSKLLDMLRDYDKWRNSGFIHSKVTSMVGAPSENLRAAIGNDVLYGRSAEDRMYRIVLTSDAQDAYQTGTMDPIDTNPSAPAASGSPAK